MTDEPSQETVSLLASDGVLTRAQKIWGLIGFANDRFGQVAALACYLASYQELDRKAWLKANEKQD